MARKKRKRARPLGGWQVFYGMCALGYAIYLFGYGYNWTELRFTSHEDATIGDMLSEYVGGTVVNLAVILLALVTRRGRLLTAMLFLQTILIFITAYAARTDIEFWLQSSHARSWWDMNPRMTSDIFVWSGVSLLVVSSLLAPILMGMKRMPRPHFSDQWASDTAGSAEAFEDPAPTETAVNDDAVAADAEDVPALDGEPA